ncbi:T9SS type B sorting domain-containing protein [Algibacter luteus]|uniref:T9SS type B sorting domain-containing protein n=1 Tax=Algibacter luteus TaxID=1178825 RepID=UPI002596082C|nr:T9SS type B sorting domain-containing protein [Algibacter luteus]WJJ95716.1 T9SS type B sorting domain-containing protein [Algibacter luteus]
MLYATIAYGQKEAANWYFGKKAGVSFTEPGPQALLNGRLDTNEGCATISNNKGELLFYTDGITVWNRNHNVMLNGQSLLGDPSSSQSAIIVPKPKSNSIYYIFTVAATAGNDGLRYSEVDMNLDNGKGAITNVKNVLLTTPSTEKITAVQHANGLDFWVIAHAWNNANFLSYRITESGVSTSPVISSVGSIHNGDAGNSIGYMKASPNGKKVALAKWNIDSVVEIFDFDANTGILTKPITIDNVFGKEQKTGAYGIEFSPNSKVLYVSDVNLNNSSSKLYQFDLSNSDKQSILDSSTIIYSGSDILSAIQLAIDRKLYISNTVSSYLDVIEYPNTIGFACNYNNQGLSLNRRITIFGLPPFIQSFFVAKIEANNVCLGNVNSFKIDTDEPIDEINWDFGDGVTSNVQSPEHVYEFSGVYTVNATIISMANTYNLTTQVEIFDNPKIEMQTEYFICDAQPIKLSLNTTHDAYLWSTGETKSEITIDTPGSYKITVFDSYSGSSVFCESSLDIRVIESGMPKSIQIDTVDWTRNNNSIIIQAEGIGQYEYSLNNENYQSSNRFDNLSSGDYIIYIRDSNGCGVLEEEVYLLDYPKFFTPNGDGVHDLWNIRFAETEPSISIQIFDRYGKLLKAFDQNSTGWDGTFNGAIMPTDGYWFVVNRPSKNKIYKGHFTLKR